MTNPQPESNNGSNFNDDALQEAYQHMYSQWLKVHEKNKFLVIQVLTLLNLKKKIESRVWRLLLLRKKQS